jgi:hypothetical protein
MLSLAELKAFANGEWKESRKRKKRKETPGGVA